MSRIYRMSVKLTIAQVRAGTKHVTRRHPDTWRSLEPDDRLRFIEQGRGLPKGAKQVVIRDGLVVSNRIEPLGLVDADECTAEGFPGHDPGLWRVWWAGSHGHKIPRGTDPDDVLAYVDAIECRRIEFTYI